MKNNGAAYIVDVSFENIDTQPVVLKPPSPPPPLHKHTRTIHTVVLL